jgi:hypothetical protein
VEAGLQFFKHRKRVLYVSSTKPVRHPAGQIFSDGITAILKTIEATPRLKRPELAAKILGEQPDAPEAVPRKEQLASDLHYLIHTGHVIEFSNGILELPLAPLEKPAGGQPAKPAASESTVESADDSEVIEGAEEESEPTAETAAQPSAEVIAPAAAEEIETPLESAPVPASETVLAEATPAEVIAEEPVPAPAAAPPSAAHAAEESSDPSLAH